MRERERARDGERGREREGGRASESDPPRVGRASRVVERNSQQLATEPITRRHNFISQKVLTEYFCRSQLSHEYVNAFFVLAIVKDKLMDLWGC